MQIGQMPSDRLGEIEVHDAKFRVLDQLANELVLRRTDEERRLHLTAAKRARGIFITKCADERRFRRDACGRQELEREIARPTSPGADRDLPPRELRDLRQAPKLRAIENPDRFVIK